MTRPADCTTPTSLKGDERASSPTHAKASLRDRRSSSGFTLVELLVVVLIMGIIAAFALPGIRAARWGYQISTAGYAVATKLDEARTNALKRNSQSWLLVDGPGKRMVVQATSGGATVNVGGFTYLPEDVQFPNGTQQVTFDAVGRPLTAPQSIQVEHVFSKQVRTISIASTGRISVQ